MMDERTVVAQKNGALAEEEPAPEEANTCADITIFCHPHNVRNLVEAFELQIKQVGDLPMFVFWSGESGVLHQGVIVLQWEGKVSPAFLQNLAIDHEIFDYVVCEWTQSTDSQEDDATTACRIVSEVTKGS